MKANSQASRRDTAVSSRASVLASWFEQHARPLPWRSAYEPYHVWTSEVMLQQTQIDTVLPYYARFLERFPTLASLADSSEDEVLKLWSGLGYYQRARRFRMAAKEVVSRHGGEVPTGYDEIMSLPGIGRYMAGAILSIAFNKPYPIVDGNVRRVLSRYNGWRDPLDSDLWREAGALVETGMPRRLNQGLMELGATVCRTRAPRCDACPWQRGCVASVERTWHEIPAPRKRAQTVRVDLSAVVDSNATGLLMREKEGLWEFPLLDEVPGDRHLVKVGHCRHAITHHRLEVDVYVGRLGRRSGYRRVQFEAVAVTSLTRKIYGIVSGML